jgi:hypothetical protein
VTVLKKIILQDIEGFREVENMDYGILGYDSL